jgi:hypothetical protein
MADYPIAEMILQNVVATIKQIDVDEGYYTSVRTVKPFETGPFDPPYPVAGIYVSFDRASDTGDYVHNCREMFLNIEYWLQEQVPGNKATELQCAIADIQKIMLTVDNDRGGYALQTILEDVQPFVTDVEDIFGAIVGFRIPYRFQYGEPSLP